MSRQDTLRAYGALFSHFTPQALERIEDLCRADVVFRDPFHAVTGRDRMRAIFAAMFELFEAPRFVVHDLALGDTRGFILWTFEGGLQRGQRLTFDGTSTLTFDDDDRIASHVDHWDAAEAIHGRLPVLGWAIRRVNARIVAAAGGGRR